MRESKSDRGGVDGALDRSLDSDGRNTEGTEKRLGRNYAPRGRGKAAGRKSKSRSAKRS